MPSKSELLTEERAVLKEDRLSDEGDNALNSKILDSNSWNRCFFKECSKFINPPDERISHALQKNEPVEFFVLKLERIEGNFNKLQVNSFLE
jgi:hypothetical protein